MVASSLLHFFACLFVGSQKWWWSNNGSPTNSSFSCPLVCYQEWWSDDSSLATSFFLRISNLSFLRITTPYFLRKFLRLFSKNDGEIMAASPPPIPSYFSSYVSTVVLKIDGVIFASPLLPFLLPSTSFRLSSRLMEWGWQPYHLLSSSFACPIVRFQE